MSKSRSTLISVISSKIREAQRGMWIEGINCLRASSISIRLDMTLANKRHQQNKAIQNGYYAKSLLHPQTVANFPVGTFNPRDKNI